MDGRPKCQMRQTTYGSNTASRGKNDIFTCLHHVLCMLIAVLTYRTGDATLCIVLHTYTRNADLLSRSHFTYNHLVSGRFVYFDGINAYK